MNMTVDSGCEFFGNIQWTDSILPVPKYIFGGPYSGTIETLMDTEEIAACVRLLPTSFFQEGTEF